MTFDELQKTWQSQQDDFKLRIDSDILLSEVKRNQRSFVNAIFWRDVREAGIGVLLVAVFLYFGIKSGLWPLYLLAIFSLWVSVFIVVDRILQKSRQTYPSDSLFNCVNSSLAQINHQILLLRNVLWWYVAPLGVGLIIWFGYCGSLKDIVVVVFLCWGIYWLNQRAIRKELAPRKHELEELLSSLKNTKV
ncbi:MAG: hypothetical protein ACYS9Y_05565 [Planctomycetota bacterium]|jgi:hypothetical protein